MPGKRVFGVGCQGLVIQLLEHMNSIEAQLLGAVAKLWLDMSAIVIYCSYIYYRWG